MIEDRITMEDMFDDPPRDPIVKYTAEAWAKIRYLVDNCPIEVGWIGIVSRYNQDFIIHDICAPPQEATSATFEWDKKGYDEAMRSLMMSGACDTGEDGEPRGMHNIGHSHVNMGTSPSSVDNDQLTDYFIEGRDFMIQDIHNKSGDYTVNIWDFDNRRFYKDVKILIGSILTDDEMCELDSQLDEVKRPVYPINPYFSKYNNVIKRDIPIPNSEELDELEELEEFIHGF